jgi:hypothetical protein
MQQINETISLQLTYPNSRPRYGHSAAPPQPAHHPSGRIVADLPGLAIGRRQCRREVAAAVDSSTAITLGLDGGNSSSIDGAAALLAQRIPALPA